jgi:hypothetical protein
VTSRVRHRPALFETWGCRGLSHLHSLTHDFFTTTICDARHRRPSQTPRAPHARCPRFRPVFWALTWVPLYPGGHVRCATFRALCEEPALSGAEGVEFHTARNHCVPPNFFHHIFLVRSSQTCTTIAAKIPRQCTIENCARLQRRTRFRPQTFHVLFDNKCSDKWPRSAPPQVHAKQQNSTLSPIF